MQFTAMTMLSFLLAVARLVFFCFPATATPVQVTVNQRASECLYERLDQGYAVIECDMILAMIACDVRAY